MYILEKRQLKYLFIRYLFAKFISIYYIFY